MQYIERQVSTRSDAGCGFMRCSIRLRGYFYRLIVVVSLIFPFGVRANPIGEHLRHDNTLPTRSKLEPIPHATDTDFLIKGGTPNQDGTSLFHSFDKFSIPVIYSVYFSNSDNVNNIFARVTGSHRSEIDGTLGVNGNANLFFINPNGIIFRDTANLDIDGSLFLSTAESIKFQNGKEFSSKGTINDSVLSLSIPLGLQDPAKTGNISSSADLVVGENLTISSDVFNLTGKIESAGKTTLLANFVDLKNAEVNVQGTQNGSIEIQAQNFNMSNSSLIAGTKNTSADKFKNLQLGDIVIEVAEDFNILDNSKILNNIQTASSGNSGNIKIQANNITLENESSISATLFGTGKSGTIKIHGDGFFNLDKSTIFNQVANTAQGISQGIKITAGKLNLKNEAFIFNGIFSDKSLGNIVNSSDSIEIKVNGATSLNNSQISSQITEGSLGNIQKIHIESGSLSLLNDSQITTSIFGSGAINGISIETVGDIEINNSLLSSRIEEDGTGKNFGIEIKEAQSLYLKNGGTISGTTFGQGDASQIIIKINDHINISGQDTKFNPSSIFTQVEKTGRGKGGEIRIFAKSLTLEKGATIDSSLRGTGSAGLIFLEIVDSVIVQGERSTPEGSKGSQIVSRIDLPESEGNAGKITIKANSLELLSGGFLSAVTRGMGDAGLIDLDITDKIRINGTKNDESPSAIFSQVQQEAQGNSAGVKIETGTLAVTNGGVISTTTNSRKPSGGNAGNVVINAREEVIFDGFSRTGKFNSALISRVEEGSNGNSGNIDITLEEGGLLITNGAEITSSTKGRGNAGFIKITAQDFIHLDGVGNNVPSSILSEVKARAIGNANKIEITTNSLALTNGARISNTTFGKGQGGDIDIKALSSIQAIGDSKGSLSGIFSETRSNTTNRGGFIKIATPYFSVRDGGQVSSSTFGQGHAGNIDITADIIEVVGIGSDETANNTESFNQRSGIRSQTNRDATGNGGQIKIDTAQLLVKDGGRVAVKTFGSNGGKAGDAGSIEINASDIVQIIGAPKDPNFFSTISAQSNRPAENDEQLPPTGNAGDVKITSPRVLVQNGGHISAATFGTGDAGSVTINASDVITVSGSTSNGEVPSRIRTSASRDSNIGAATGKAGNLTLKTSKLLVKDGGQIQTRTFGPKDAGKLTIESDSIEISGTTPSGRQSAIRAESQGLGNAGNITIKNTETLTVRDGNILTNAEQASGGAIDIASKHVRLWGDGDIKTNVSSGAGGAGNITLEAESVIAFDDSDILAFAADGRGGDITLDTPAFFGENYQPAQRGTDPETVDGNGRVDINATGAIDGLVTLPDVSFIEDNLADLPDEPLDKDSLLSRSCLAQGEDGKGQLLITGSGGLPPRPGDIPINHAEIITMEDLASESEQNTGWKRGDPIEEPVALYQVGDRPVMVGACK